MVQQQEINLALHVSARAILRHQKIVMYIFWWQRYLFNRFSENFGLLVKSEFL